MIRELAGGPGSGRKKGGTSGKPPKKKSKGKKKQWIAPMDSPGRGMGHGRRRDYSEKADLISFKRVVLADKPYNPQLNQIKDQMERIRHGMKNKKGDARKPDKTKLNELQVRRDRLERVTEVK